MSNTKEERHEDGARPGRGGDTASAQGDNQAPKARQPNEHDESADSQAADSEAIREMGRIAHAATERGQQDTSRAPEADAAYRRVRKGA